MSKRDKTWRDLGSLYGAKLQILTSDPKVEEMCLEYLADKHKGYVANYPEEMFKYWLRGKTDKFLEIFLGV